MIMHSLAEDTVLLCGRIQCNTFSQGLHTEYLILDFVQHCCSSEKIVPNLPADPDKGNRSYEMQPNVNKKCNKNLKGNIPITDYERSETLKNVECFQYAGSMITVKQDVHVKLNP